MLKFGVFRMGNLGQEKREKRKEWEGWEYDIYNMNHPALQAPPEIKSGQALLIVSFFAMTGEVL